MRHQSLHDSLTGLPNRTLLFDRIEHAFARAERFGFGVAVLLLDVDGFKTVNDSLGHQAGDELLVEVGSRLTEVVRASDTVARLGGDEFVVLAEVESDEEAFEIAERIASVWEQPFAVASGEVYCSASVGIAVRRESQAPAKMLREADAAMYRAKERGRGRSELFDEVMRRDAFERLRTESDLRRALERDEFRVLYQPIFDTATLRPIAVEALVRWQHPDPRGRRAGRVHPARRGDRSHRAARPLGARARRRRGRRLAPSASPTCRCASRSTSRASSSRAPSSSRRSARRSRPPTCRPSASGWRSPSRSSSRSRARRARPSRRCARSA